MVLLKEIIASLPDHTAGTAANLNYEIEALKMTLDEEQAAQAAKEEEERARMEAQAALAAKEEAVSIHNEDELAEPAFLHRKNPRKPVSSAIEVIDLISDDEEEQPDPCTIAYKRMRLDLAEKIKSIVC